MCRSSFHALTINVLGFPYNPASWMLISPVPLFFISLVLFVADMIPAVAAVATDISRFRTAGTDKAKTSPPAIQPSGDMRCSILEPHSSTISTSRIEYGY